jgi:hypothetical protein
VVYKDPKGFLINQFMTITGSIDTPLAGKTIKPLRVNPWGLVNMDVINKFKMKESVIHITRFV